MKPVIIIVIAFVLLIPTTVFAQQLSISISANPVPVEYQGNDFTVNFEGELFNNGKIYWSVYDKNSSNKPGQQLVILPTDTKLWTKTVPAVYFPSVGQTYIFEIKNGNVIETFEFIVQKKINAPLESLSPFFDSCENGLWIGHFKNEKTGEQIQSGKVFLYDDKGQRTKTTALFPPEGYLKIYPNGNEDYPPVHWVLVRSGSYEDLEFQPVCVELPSWIKSTALWWSEDAITNDECDACYSGWESDGSNFRCEESSSVTDAILKTKYDVELTLKFTDDYEKKAGKIFINGYQFHFFTYKDEYKRTINNYIEDSTNSIKIEPDQTVLDIRSLTIKVDD